MIVLNKIECVVGVTPVCAHGAMTGVIEEADQTSWDADVNRLI
jgi:hypothetical protein